MGFTYFGKKKWIEISREERLYCAHLYWAIKSKENNFIKWVSKHPECRIQFTSDEMEDYWEIGYEVCLYRDYLKHRGKSIKSMKISQKRTFDLCLFSESRIIIIEAKAHQGFRSDQIKSMKKDRKLVRSLLGGRIRVNLISISSGRYIENLGKYGNFENLRLFDLNLTWQDIYNLYRDKIYLRAESLYGSH